MPHLVFYKSIRTSSYPHYLQSGSCEGRCADLSWATFDGWHSISQFIPLSPNSQTDYWIVPIKQGERLQVPHHLNEYSRQAQIVLFPSLNSHFTSFSFFAMFELSELKDKKLHLNRSNVFILISLKASS